MKKVLITGGAGFIGSNFAHKFLELGYNVNLIDRRGVNLWRLQDLKDKIKINYVDIENYDELEPFLSELNPQIILHFAAAGTYTRRPEDIRSIIDANLLGTINLVNACSKIKIECFINTGSSSEYGAKEKPMKENDLLEANNLYGITKTASTLYCQYMAKKLDLPIVTARPFAVYGYFEEKERLIPTIIKSCLENTELELSSPSSVRDFVFIEDVVKAYLAIIENIQKDKRIGMAVLYGSYAKGIANHSSDIDIYIETKSRNVKKTIEEIHSKINVKIGTFDTKSPLIKEIIKDHVIIRGIEVFYDKQVPE